MWNIISGFDTLITDYFYNSQDQVTDYSHTGKGEKISYRNSYDYAGRLDRADKYDIPDIPNPDFINLAAYSYNPNSQVLQNDLNDGNIRLYYYYNNRGWISEMFDNNGFLDYTNDYFKNGNVKSQQISGNYNDNFTVSTDLSYTYGYDKSNRLLTSENADKIYDLTNSFDKDGNILSLVRTNGIGSVSDDFSYAYYSGTNKLQRVIGAGSQFSYDANGNLIQDAFNNNNEILYDYRNLITELKHRSQIIGDTVYLTKYYYDEAGNRIRKMTYAYLQPVSESEPPANSDVSNTSNWALRNDEVYSHDVSGKEMAIYQNNSLLEYPTYGLDMIGKIKDDELHFYLKDHLGSIRATVYDNKLISAQDYDAWGYILEGRTYESEEGKFRFTGKERDEESFYDYFGARYYDARVGRWGQVDPMSEKSPSFTPFQFARLNPLYFIDPDGAFELPEKYITKYPKLAAFLRYEIPKLAENQTIMSALIKNTGLTKEEISEGILKWGKGPKVIVEDIGRNSQGFERFGTHVVGSLEIKINEKWVDMFVNSNGDEYDISRFLLGVTILHEGVHVGSEFGGDNIDFSEVYDIEELGASFEYDAYGQVIYNFNDAVEVLNQFSKRNNISKRYSKIKESE